MNLGPNAYGVLFASVTSVSWAVFTYFIKRALTDAPVLKVTAAMTTVNAALVTLIAVFFISVEDFWGVTATTLTFAFLAGFFHIGISRSFFYRAIHRIGPNRSIPIALTYPVITAVGASFMLGETPTLSIITGLLILLVGITLIVQAEPSQSAESDIHGARWKMFGLDFRRRHGASVGHIRRVLQKSVPEPPSTRHRFGRALGGSRHGFSPGVVRQRRGIARRHSLLGVEVDFRRRRMPGNSRAVL